MSRLDARDRVVLTLLAAGVLAPVAYLLLRPLLLTAALLAVPFAVWWVRDRNQPAQVAKRRAAAAEKAARAHDRKLLAGWLPPPRIDPEQEARRADELGMPQSAAWWRTQPPLEPLPDEAEWQARIARQRAREAREGQSRQ